MLRLRVVLLAGCVLTQGCEFRQGAISAIDGGAQDDDARQIDARALDAELDATMKAARVRPIDIEDTLVSGGPHADFPVLLSLGGTWLRSVAQGGDVARADGFDIHFSEDQAGTMPLAHELELYDPATGTLVAWVRVPSLAAATTFYLHYGDPALVTDPQNVTSVWSAGYEGVFHLDGITDSTGKTAAPTAATSGSPAGQIDRALTFDGADDYLDVGSVAAIDNLFAGGGSAEAWFYAVDWGEATFGRLFDKGHVSGWSLWLNNTDVAASMSFLHGTTGGGWGWWSTPANSVTLDAWHHVAVVYDKTSVANVPTVYLDGVAVAITTLANASGSMLDDSAATLRAGNRGSLDRTFDGQLDELRLSSAARGAGWIMTEYANQLEPGTFALVGAEL